MLHSGPLGYQNIFEEKYNELVDWTLHSGPLWHQYIFEEKYDEPVDRMLVSALQWSIRVPSIIQPKYINSQKKHKFEGTPIFSKYKGMLKKGEHFYS